jgi:hypothetical protein
VAGTPMPDTDPPFDSVASKVGRYLASFAMTAVATAVAVGVDSKVTIPASGESQPLDERAHVLHPRLTRPIHGTAFCKQDYI